MSRNPAKKMIAAPRKNLPTAKLAAAPKFTTSPKNVNTFGLIPVAAIAPTILSSSHLLPVPIAPVSVAIFGGEVHVPPTNKHLFIVSQPCRGPQTTPSPQANLASDICCTALFHRFFSIDLAARK